MSTDDRATKRIAKFMMVDTQERSTKKIPKFQLEKLIGAHVPTAEEEQLDGEWVTLDDWASDDSPESLDPSLLVEITDTQPPPLPIDRIQQQAS